MQATESTEQPAAADQPCRSNSQMQSLAGGQPLGNLAMPSPRPKPVTHRNAAPVHPCLARFRTWEPMPGSVRTWKPMLGSVNTWKPMPSSVYTQETKAGLGLHSETKAGLGLHLGTKAGLGSHLGTNAMQRGVCSCGCLGLIYHTSQNDGSIKKKK